MCFYPLKSKLCRYKSVCDAIQMILFLYHNFIKKKCLLSNRICAYDSVPVWKFSQKLIFISYSVNKYLSWYTEEDIKICIYEHFDFQKTTFLVTLNEWVWLAIRLCPSSSLLLSAWTFLVFRILLSNRSTDLLQILGGCSLGGPLLRLLKSGCYPYFSWNYG